MRGQSNVGCATRTKHRTQSDTIAIEGVDVPPTLGGLRHALRSVQDLTRGGSAWLTLPTSDGAQANQM
jgi:hypothetical protein